MSKDTIGHLSAVFAAGALIVFALAFAVFDIKLNLASWVCWFVLDCVIVYQTWPRERPGLAKEAQSRPWLMMGYTIGAGIVCLLLLFKGVWQWSNVETVILALSVASMGVMLTAGARKGVIAATVAMIVAGIPSMIDGWHHPQPWVALFWGVCMVTSTLSLFATKRWSIEERLVPSASAAFNLVMCVLMVS